MKILIVEDDAAKLQAVALVCQKVDGVMVEIDSAQNAAQAKRALASSDFDIVILDVSLPTTAGEAPTPAGGITLMEEVIRRPKYRKPSVWIGLTAYEENIVAAMPTFSSELWSLVYYDPTSKEWASQLQRKISYMSVLASSPAIPKHNADLCIIVALPVPELAACLKIDWKWAALPMSLDGVTYHEGFYLSQEGEKRRVIAAAASQMGLTATAVLATKMICRFSPRYVAMCGIAAGVRGACELGDVICADPCWDWGSGKIAVDENGRSVFRPAPSQLRLDPLVRGRALSLGQDSAAWDEVRRNWPVSMSAVISMRVGPFASGAAVLSDNETANEIKEQHRQLIGIDMEAYAVFAAAFEAPAPQPKALVLKSVTDFADALKGDSHREYAAYTSAQALRIFAERFI